jgi:hypothetical protein
MKGRRGRVRIREDSRAVRRLAHSCPKRNKSVRIHHKDLPKEYEELHGILWDFTQQRKTGKAEKFCSAVILPPRDVVPACMPRWMAISTETSCCIFSYSRKSLLHFRLVLSLSTVHSCKLAGVATSTSTSY